MVPKIMMICDNHVDDVTKANRPVILQILWIILFGNQNNSRIIHSFRHHPINEEGLNCLDDILLQEIPITLKKRGRKTIWPGAFRGPI